MDSAHKSSIVINCGLHIFVFKFVSFSVSKLGVNWANCTIDSAGVGLGKKVLKYWICWCSDLSVYFFSLLMSAFPPSPRSHKEHTHAHTHIQMRLQKDCTTLLLHYRVHFTGVKCTQNELQMSWLCACCIVCLTSVDFNTIQLSGEAVQMMGWWLLKTGLSIEICNINLQFNHQCYWKLNMGPFLAHILNLISHCYVPINIRRNWTYFWCFFFIFSLFSFYVSIQPCAPLFSFPYWHR